MNLNFTEVGKELNISQQAASKKIHKYENNEKLKPYLIYDENGSLIGLEQSGIDILRNLGTHRRSFSTDRRLMDLQHQIELLQQENEALKELYQQQLRFSEDYKAQNEKLRAEINEFCSAGIIKRLTYKHKA